MFDHILVPMDGSALAECVLPHIVAFARAVEARVTLIHVLEGNQGVGSASVVDPLDWHINRIEAEAYLDDVTSRLRNAGLAVRSVVVEGQAAECIIDFAHRNDVSLIVLSSHGRSGLSRWNVSSVVQKILLQAYTSTLLVRAYQPVFHELTALPYQRLLVTLDCSHRAENALTPARLLAVFYKVPLALAHVVQRPTLPCREPPSQQDIELANQLTKRNREVATKYLKHLHSRLSSEGIDARIHLLDSDNSAETLHELVEEQKADLVMMNAHGHTGGRKWPFGSCATSFIAYGTAPLLIMQDLSPDEVIKTRAEKAAVEYKGH